jgi:hypothetical protein
MKMARLCTLLICAAGLLSHADANQICLGFNSLLTSPADGWVMVNNNNPLAGLSSLQGTPALIAPARSGDPYVATNFNAATFAPVVKLNKGDPATSVAANTLSVPDNLEVRFSANGASPSLAANGIPASFTLEQATVPSMSAIATGSYYLPPIYPFIVSESYYPSSSFAFLAADAEAPEPAGVSLGLLGCALLAALAAWRRKNMAA